MQERFDTIEAKLDKIDGKLDNHMDRLARIEVENNHHAGQIKMIISAAIAIITSIAAAAVKYLIK